MSLEFEPERVERDLAELSRLAPERVAWSEDWRRAREWFFLRGRAAGLAFELDRAGNQWFSAGGGGSRADLIGGHLDTTPVRACGDGSLSLLAGLEVARVLAASRSGGAPLRVVNWADGAGSRFGRPFGASAAAGRLRDWYAAEELVDATGTSLREAAHACGVQPKLAQTARRLLAGAPAYIEIGSDPVFGSPADRPLLSAVAGAMGVERCRLRWSLRSPAGRGDRHEPLLRQISDRFARGLDRVSPDAPLRSQPERVAGHPSGNGVEQFLELRHSDPAILEGMLEAALELSDRIASEGGASVEWRRLWRTSPVEFDAGLTDLVGRALPRRDPGPITRATTLQSGASELARSGLPAALLLAGPEPGGWPVTTIEAALQALVAFIGRAGTRAGAEPAAGT